MFFTIIHISYFCKNMNNSSIVYVQEIMQFFYTNITALQTYYG